uniref:Beta-glucosidase 18-like n=1 Tax=Nicotiana tabacum TaxID=4097 RepID=A0A1S3Z1F1_TOBAC|nr:PREDICTED: beta-glucosidase 18-like [Nicotiana tabacum]
MVVSVSLPVSAIVRVLPVHVAFGSTAAVAMLRFSSRARSLDPRAEEKSQRGMIGITMGFEWYEPLSNSSEDIAATHRARSFYDSWFLDPIILGRYPKEMVQILGSNLPELSMNDLSKLSYGLDFIGINHYSAVYIKDCLYSACEHGNSWSEGSYFRTTQRDGIYIGEPGEVDWQFVYPQGIEKVVMYLKDKFNNTPMFITENGFAGNSSSIEDALNDVRRVKYLHSNLNSLANAIRKGADVRGYFVWSLLDNFEWLDGYSIRFGLYYVNYTNLQRTPKLSATKYQELMYNFHIELETHTALK